MGALRVLARWARVALAGGLLAGALATCTGAPERVPEARLHTRLGPPQPGEWLYHHPEAGQSFKEYVASKPVRPTPARRKFYLLPLGEFDPAEQQALEVAAAYLEAMWGLPVVVQPRQGRATLPDSALRTRNDGTVQLHTKYVLYRVLRLQLPPDALIYQALTTVDLFPAPNWNFVFGQAALRERVGVSSMARFKEYDAQGRLLTQKMIQRLAKTVAHETTHAFSIPHCKEFRCLMNGSNSLEEADRKPFSTCPDCTRKVLWASRATPKQHYQRLLAFYEANKWAEEAGFCRLALAGL
jgi:archaemetzincin